MHQKDAFRKPCNANLASTMDAIMFASSFPSKITATGADLLFSKRNSYQSENGTVMDSCVDSACYYERTGEMTKNRLRCITVAWPDRWRWQDDPEQTTPRPRGQSHRLPPAWQRSELECFQNGGWEPWHHASWRSRNVFTREWSDSGDFRFRIACRQSGSIDVVRLLRRSESIFDLRDPALSCEHALDEWKDRWKGRTFVRQLSAFATTNFSSMVSSVEKHRKNSPLLRGQMTVPHEGAHWRSWGGHVASVMLVRWHNVLAKNTSIIMETREVVFGERCFVSSKCLYDPTIRKVQCAFSPALKLLLGASTLLVEIFSPHSKWKASPSWIIVLRTLLTFFWLGSCSWAKVTSLHVRMIFENDWHFHRRVRRSRKRRSVTNERELNQHQLSCASLVHKTEKGEIWRKPGIY